MERAEIECNSAVQVALALDDPVVQDSPALEQHKLVIAVYWAYQIGTSGQAVPSHVRDAYQDTLAWLDRLRTYLAELLLVHEHLLVVGDFNIAPEDRDVHDPAAWEGSVHVSPPEREALGRIVSLGLEDLFRRFEQPKNAWSWWDYRMNAFRRDHGLRIDLMLASKPLAERCAACTIDRVPRAWERPSDHAPVIATFDIG